MNNLKSVFDAILQKTITYFSEEFSIEDILVAIVGYIVIKLINKAFDFVKHKIKKDTRFNVTGFWITRFPSFINNDRDVIELYYIKQKHNELAIKIQHYCNCRTEISKLYGKGEIRGDFIVCYYSTNKRDSKALGAICLKINNEDVEELLLQGNVYEDYSHLSKKKQDDIYKLQKRKILNLKKIKIPWYKKILFWYNFKSFYSFENVKFFLEGK